MKLTVEDFINKYNNEYKDKHLNNDLIDETINKKNRVIK